MISSNLEKRFVSLSIPPEPNIYIWQSKVLFDIRRQHLTEERAAALRSDWTLSTGGRVRLWSVETIERLQHRSAAGTQ